MIKQKEILLKIREAVRKIEPKSEIILFGSRARGDERADSDWDILILIPGAVDIKTEQRFRHALFHIELDFGEAISTFVHSKEDWEKKFRVTPLYQNIKTEGVSV